MNQNKIPLKTDTGRTATQNFNASLFSESANKLRLNDGSESNITHEAIVPNNLYHHLKIVNISKDRKRNHLDNSMRLSQPYFGKSIFESTKEVSLASEPIPAQDSHDDSLIISK